MNSQNLLQNLAAGQDIGNSFPSRSHDTVPVAWAEHSTTLWQMRRGGNPLPDDDQFGRIAFWMRNHYRQGSQTADSWRVIPHLQERKWTSWRHWPNVMGWKNWKSSFRRDGLDYHPGQAREWLADIEDLDDVGSVFGSTRMSFDTPDSQIAEGLMKIMNLAFNKEKFRWPKNFKQRPISRCSKEDRSRS